MILKDKTLQNVVSPTAKAGQKQEQDVAFFLRRAFKDHKQVFVINDFKFTFNDETAQIDHLIVYPYGFLLIESKSIKGEVIVNKLGEWTRSYNAKWSGMASPIKQVELQQGLLRQLLHENKESILSKLLGIRQQSFGGRSWDNLCAISSDAILDRESMPEDISNHLVKSEFLVDKINEIMRLRPAIVNALNPFDNRPDFSDKELDSITSFLMGQLNIKAVNKEQINKKVVEPKAPVEKSNVLIDAVLQCKSCGEKSDYSAQYGRYGYFIKCHKCETNTAMKIPCLSCASKKTKVSKNKEVYTLHCSDCEQGTVLI
jgi:hypothetical protein